MGVLPAGMSVYHLHAVPTEITREHWIPWNWVYSESLATMWVLGTNRGPWENDNYSLQPT